MNASIVLTPAASKRLIARGVAAHPTVTRAMRDGRIVIARGTTNAFVAEELLGQPIDRGAYAAGFIDRLWNVNARVGDMEEILLERGRPATGDPEKILASLGAGDVLIKGGNAIDPWGVVGVLLASPSGGTVGRYVPSAVARGVDIIIPISLSKSIHTSVVDLSQEMGSGRISLHSGLACGLYPLHGQLITEVEAMRLVADVDAVHVASNGVGAGHGSVSLFLYGEEEEVKRAFALAEELVGETDVELAGRT
ncbi:MAG: hypothetical protein PHV11_00930 [Candidatus Bipolaricaulis sp.]|nr:hypothetical protein [Candidatus Bipolaricaulis sp.]MDD5219115.1 hypothetical protein [Candidatus Bipolaricaulis sp.]MDD5646671.1 hypothetical protein [Candidatus Bipolaricaulis sp.]